MHVVIVGAGVSGLSTAGLLLADGHQVTLVSGDPLQNTTSHLAAAVWFPTAAGPADAVARWSAATFDRLAGEAADGVPGVVMRESLVVYRQEADVLPPLPSWAEAVGHVRRARADELPPGYGFGLRFVVPLVEMPVYLPYLFDAVVTAGGRHVERRVGALAEVLDLRPDVVVNCAGLAAGKLAGDDTMFPVRGQIVRVVNPGLTMSVRDEHHPGGRAYVHPRSYDCILGGTLEVGEWDTTPDPAKTAAILDRCIDIVPALRGADLIDSVVGLRPGRREIRLEVDRSLLPVPVVHNYGHGGSGVTVGWGCATDVAALVSRLADTASIRDALRDAVVRTMKQRDRAALAVYRTALAAIDNAESVPSVEPHRAGAIELSPLGLGRTEAPRRLLTEQDMTGIVLQEAHARRIAADSLAGAEPDAAQQLRHQADLLQALIRPAG